jgi:hypothetical protein
MSKEPSRTRDPEFTGSNSVKCARIINAYYQSHYPSIFISYIIYPLYIHHFDMFFLRFLGIRTTRRRRWQEPEKEMLRSSVPPEMLYFARGPLAGGNKHGEIDGI